MNKPFSASAAAAVALLCGGPTSATEVACHYVYGGEEHVLTAAAVASPYAVPAIAVGSYFELRVVFQDAPATVAAVHVYTYAAHGGERSLVHEASYRYPPTRDAGEPYGFTGRQLVYEPVLGSELEYWCVVPAAQKVAAQR